MIGDGYIDKEEYKNFWFHVGGFPALTAERLDHIYNVLTQVSKCFVSIHWLCIQHQVPALRCERICVCEGALMHENLMIYLWSSFVRTHTSLFQNDTVKLDVLKIQELYADFYLSDDPTSPGRYIAGPMDFD